MNWECTGCRRWVRRPLPLRTSSVVRRWPRGTSSRASRRTPRLAQFVEKLSGERGAPTLLAGGQDEHDDESREDDDIEGIRCDEHLEVQDGDQGDDDDEYSVGKASKTSHGGHPPS